VRSGLLVCTGLLVLSGCSARDPDKEAIRELKTIQSWSAAAALVAGSWTARAVPTAYAAQTMQLACEASAQSLQKLQQATTRDPVQRTAAATAAEAAALLPRMRAGIIAEDRAGTNAALAALQPILDRLDASNRRLAPTQP
jgi:hypothetical protein